MFSIEPVNDNFYQAQPALSILKVIISAS